MRVSRSHAKAGGKRRYGPGIHISRNVYDAQGRRIQKTTGSNNLQYTYDLSGRVSSELCEPCGTYNGWAGGYVFLAGRMLAQYTEGTVLFAQTDHLGSTRLLNGYVPMGVDSKGQVTYLSPRQIRCSRATNVAAALAATGSANRLGAIFTAEFPPVSASLAAISTVE